MSDVLDTCAARIAGLALGHPARIAVDGITGAGKTTFAGHLATVVEQHGLTTIQVSMDGFHHPRATRYRQGRASADGYYEDAYDFAAVRSALLDPLGDGGDRCYRSAVIDLAADVPVDDPPVEAPADAVVIVDGSFLQKPELRGAWDLVIYLRASFDVAAQRGAQRDADILGGIDAARTAFRDRYHAAQRRYLDECGPERTADVVIDVEDPARPRIVR